MVNILFIHQDAELYGSDKVLLYLVQGLHSGQFNPIVLLPWDGPLVSALEDRGITVCIVPLVKLCRATFTSKALITMPFSMASSIRAINRALGDTRIDVVHSNTLAAFSGAFWARLRRVPHVWHVHEMIVNPWLIRHMFPLLLDIFSDSVPCNSRATENLLLVSRPRLKKKTSVIWNGLDSNTIQKGTGREFRRKLGVREDEILVTLVGRINRWKGQRLFIDAAEIIAASGIADIRYLIVGSTPAGQNFFMDVLKSRIASAGLESRCILLDFQQDISKVWDATDIAVVPSTEPEPFGMVALEAMAAGKPVIAAAHGGLLDIVVDGETGKMFEPNNPVALARSILELCTDTAIREELGRGGAKRLRKVFTLDRYVEKFQDLYKSLLGKDRFSASLNNGESYVQ